MDQDQEYDEVATPQLEANLRWLWVTVGDMDQARHIAEELVSGRLAACVNLIPQLESIYRWQGEVCRDSEIAMVVKTSADQALACQEMIIALHPAELPCVLSFSPDGGSPPFMQWVAQQVSLPPAADSGGDGVAACPP